MTNCQAQLSIHHHIAGNLMG